MSFYIDPETLEGTLLQKWSRLGIAWKKRRQLIVPSKDEHDRASLDLSWAFEAMSGDVGHSTSQQIMSTISALNVLLGKRQFDEIGMIFAIINPERLSPELMLTLVRVTYPVRKLIPGWYNLLRRIKGALDARRLDSRSLLIGLL